MYAVVAAPRIWHILDVLESKNTYEGGSPMAQNEIYGNLKGIRNSVIDELKTFYDIRLESGQLLTA